MTRSDRKAVSAVDAKAHLSSLIRDVEKGTSHTITRRGRPVARLTPVEPFSAESVREPLEGFHAVRMRVKGGGGIRELIDEGRKR